jgi:hypothetical protein
MGDNDDADPAQEQEWLRESDLINGGLILIGVYMVQPYLTAGLLDLSARICVVAGFWHIWWIAGVGMLTGGLVAVSVHAAATWA